MSTRSKEKARKDAHRGGVPWMIPGLFIGFIVGLVDELIYGISMIRMMEGAVAGLAVGALADFIRNRMRKDPPPAKKGHKFRVKKT